MKKVLNPLLIISTISFLFFACKKEETRVILTNGISPSLVASSTSLVLTQAHANDTSETFSWSASQYGFIGAINYTVQIAKGGTSFANPQKVSISAGILSLKLAVSSLNSYAIASGLATGSAGTLDIRIASKISDSIAPIYSNTVTITVTPYQSAYPALMLQGGNSWITPSTYTPGYIVSSPTYDNNYEGYLHLPNADGYGGDAFKLVSTTTGTVYGWASNPATDPNVSGGFFVNMAVGAGNLWLTPAPNNVKVNVNLSTLTLNYVPVQFYISGDDNGWSTSATPMTFNSITNKWVATGVTLTSGNHFVFTCNGAYDISYKVDGTGKMIFAGPPAWAGNNIPVLSSGVHTVTLDLSGGNGSYTYSVQ